MDDSLLDEIESENGKFTINVNNPKDLPSICCFCGKSKYEHYGSTHKFIQIQNEYKCRKCNKFLYHHRMNTKCIFIPYKYI